MNTPRKTTLRDGDDVAQQAAHWVVLNDRGLTAVEQDEFSQWLAADPRHSAAWAEHRWGWDELDRLAGLQTSVHAVPDPDLLAPPEPKEALLSSRLAGFSLALAAIVVLGMMLWRPAGDPVPRHDVALGNIAVIEQRTLPDGSVADLNRGAELVLIYTTNERRLRLIRGEASFSVTKNPARPFIVEAGGVAVRAIGTAFNVRLDSRAVDVIVTEGKVGIHRAAAAEGEEATLQLEAFQRTVVSRDPVAPAPQVMTLDEEQLHAELAWKPRLLDFTAAPLSEIIAEFNRHNAVRIVLDESVAPLRLSATFRSDNIAGFLRLMESDFRMRAQWRSDTEILLTQSR